MIYLLKLFYNRGLLLQQLGRPDAALASFRTGLARAPDDLGLLMGMQHMAFSIAGGLGPLLTGILADATGGYDLAIGLMVASVALSVLMLTRSH